MSGPNAFLDECEALVSVSIEDGTLSENQLRDLLATFGHLQSFHPSNGVGFFSTAVYSSCLIERSLVVLVLHRRVFRRSVCPVVRQQRV